MRPISFPKLPDFGVLPEILQILNLEPRSLLYSPPPFHPPPSLGENRLGRGVSPNFQPRRVSLRLPTPSLYGKS